MLKSIFMCGITGFFNIDNAPKLTFNSLKIMKNRGIDGCGITDLKKAPIYFTAPPSSSQAESDISAIEESKN